MKTIKREFHGDFIPLDFHEYDACTFVDCVLVYHGYTPPVLDRCTVRECRVEYRGPAGNALGWLAAQKRSGDPVGMSIADGLLRGAGLPT
jgi:hypothetical protein